MATKSRFLPQCVFNLYKVALATYFVFWCFYWPAADEIYDGWKYYTHYTFYVTAICERLSMSSCFTYAFEIRSES